MPSAPTPSRPRDDEVVDILSVLRWQRTVVEAAGSPVSAEILAAVIDDVAAGGPLSTELPQTVRFGSFPGLRVMAAVHRLAIERRVPRVALRLPTLGGEPPLTESARADLRRDVVDALMANTDVLQESLGHTPQTNETARAALLRCALSREDSAQPVRLREIGASAGLNLRVEHLPGQPALEAGPLPAIVDRLGCDLQPVDISTTSGRALLSSYVWVDDVDRFARLAGALRVADQFPAKVVTRDAVAFCHDLAPEPGVTTVLWHSAMWVYLPETTRAGILQETARAGEAASTDAPFVHVSWEADAGLPGLASFGLVVRRWDGGPDDGRPRLLATGSSHGSNVVLAGPDAWLEHEPLSA